MLNSDVFVIYRINDWVTITGWPYPTYIGICNINISKLEKINKDEYIAIAEHGLQAIMEHEYLTLSKSQRQNVQKYITENNNHTDDYKQMYTDSDNMQIENRTNIQKEKQMNDNPETASKEQTKEQSGDLSMSYFHLYNYNIRIVYTIYTQNQSIIMM